MIASGMRLMAIALNRIEHELQLPGGSYLHDEMLDTHVAYFLRLYFTTRVLCGLKP